MMDSNMAMSLSMSMSVPSLASHSHASQSQGQGELSFSGAGYEVELDPELLQESPTHSPGPDSPSSPLSSASSGNTSSDELQDAPFPSTTPSYYGSNNMHTLEQFGYSQLPVQGLSSVIETTQVQVQVPQPQQQMPQAGIQGQPGQTQNQPVKRKRGRPRKHPLPLDVNGNPIQVPNKKAKISATKAVKTGTGKPRGRPRKYPLPTTAAATSPQLTVPDSASAMNTAPENLSLNLHVKTEPESDHSESMEQGLSLDIDGDQELDEEYAQGDEDMTPKNKRTKKPDAMDARRRKLHHKAALARESRRKKKQRMAELESENKALQDEVDRLREMLPEGNQNRMVTPEEKDKGVSKYVQQIVLLSSAVTNGGQPMDTTEALPSLFDTLQSALERQYEGAQNQAAALSQLTDCGPLRFVSWLLEQPDSFFTDMGSLWNSLLKPSLSISDKQMAGIAQLRAQCQALRAAELKLRLSALLPGIANTAASAGPELLKASVSLAQLSAHVQLQAGDVTQALMTASVMAAQHNASLLLNLRSLLSPVQLAKLLGFATQFGAVCMQQSMAQVKAEPMFR